MFVYTEGPVIAGVVKNVIINQVKNVYINISSSSFDATSRCGLWPVEQYLSICPYLSPNLSIFSRPALEDLFPLLLSIFSWVFLFASSLPILEVHKYTF
jgi:hypothetical protein